MKSLSKGLTSLDSQGVGERECYSLSIEETFVTERFSYVRRDVVTQLGRISRLLLLKPRFCPPEEASVCGRVAVASAPTRLSQEWAKVGF